MSSWHEELGRELRESPIPAHRPDHFERIRERLGAIERAGGGGTSGGARDEARPAPARRARRRPIARLAAGVAVAAALVAAVAATWSGLPGLQRSKPATATASTVLHRVQDAMAGLDSISGDVVEYGTARGRPLTHKVGSFAFTSAGDYRIQENGLGVEYTYDSVSRVAQRITREGGKVVYGERATHLPDPGPFFGPWLGVSQVLDRSVAAYARAVIAELDPDVPVSPVTYEGRTAWRIDVAEPLVGGGTNGSVRIVVDVASGYPLLVEHWTADDDVSGTRIEHVRLDAAADHSQFTAAPDSESELVPLSERYRQLTLAQAAALGDKVPRVAAARHPARRGRASPGAAFQPYMPRWTPRGFRLDGVTGAVNGAVMGRYTDVTRDGEVGSLTVVLTYRRGFDRFCLISRWRRVNPLGSDDPFAENAAAAASVQPAPISGGALRGTIAQVVIGLPDWPHLYVTTGVDRRVSVSVAGDLTGDELVRIASSLEPIAVR